METARRRERLWQREKDKETSTGIKEGSIREREEKTYYRGWRTCERDRGLEVGVAIMEGRTSSGNSFNRLIISFEPVVSTFCIAALFPRIINDSLVISFENTCRLIDFVRDIESR